MKKCILLLAFAGTVIVSCKKSDTIDTVVTASTTQATVGQVVNLQVSTSMNAVSWTVTPAASAVKQFTITNQKTNSISFTQAGTYIIGVRARNIAFDSTRTHNIDSCWHNGGGDRGGCTHGKDSSSIAIKVI